MRDRSEFMGKKKVVIIFVVVSIILITGITTGIVRYRKYEHARQLREKQQEKRDKREKERKENYKKVLSQPKHIIFRILKG